MGWGGGGGEKKSHLQNSSLFALVLPFRHFNSRQLDVSLALVLSKDCFVVSWLFRLCVLCPHLLECTFLKAVFLDQRGLHFAVQ